MKIAIGNDHAGTKLKFDVMNYIKNEYGYEVINFGTDSDESCDYPKYGELVANAVVSGEAQRGILICGTGIGIGIAANKVNGARCAIVSEAESARLTREHNDANIISFGARIIDFEKAKEIVDTFLKTDFSNGERHIKRIGILKEIEDRQK